MPARGKPQQRQAKIGFRIHHHNVRNTNSAPQLPHACGLGENSFGAHPIIIVCTSRFEPAILLMLSVWQFVWSLSMPLSRVHAMILDNDTSSNNRIQTHNCRCLVRQHPQEKPYRTSKNANANISNKSIRDRTSNQERVPAQTRFLRSGAEISRLVRCQKLLTRTAHGAGGKEDGVESEHAGMRDEANNQPHRHARGRAHPRAPNHAPPLRADALPPRAVPQHRDQRKQREQDAVESHDGQPSQTAEGRPEQEGKRERVRFSIR